MSNQPPEGHQPAARARRRDKWTAAGKRSRAPLSRNLALPLAGALIVALVLFVVVALSIGHTAAPAGAAAPYGQWIPQPTLAPGAPTPTAAPDALLFTNVDGSLLEYSPKPDATSSLTWETYRGQADGYTIEYPSGWAKTDGLPGASQMEAVYPPGSAVSADVPGGPAGITFGLVMDYRPPESNDLSVAGRHAVSAGGVGGELYTNSGMGRIVSAVFPRGNAHFVLSADATDGLLIVVFQHMLASLRFT